MNIKTYLTIENNPGLQTLDKFYLKLKPTMMLELRIHIQVIIYYQTNSST